MSKYSRTNLQNIISPQDGSLPFLSFLDANFIRITKKLTTSKKHRVAPDEAGRLELISYREYGTVELWWLIGTYNGIILPLEELVEGTMLEIPSLSSIEDYYRTLVDRTINIVRLA